jgi:MYXO-CTERM domain-containing protein
MALFQRLMLASALAAGLVPAASHAATIDFNSVASSITSSAGYALTGTEFVSQGVRFVSNSSSPLVLYAFSSTLGTPSGVGLSASPDSSVFVVGRDFTIEIVSGFTFDLLSLDLVGAASNSIQGTVFGSSGNINVSYPAPTGAWSWLNGASLVSSTAAIGTITSISFGSNAFVGLDNLALTLSSSGGNNGGGGNVPEPASFALALAALAGIGVSRRRQA